MKKNLWKKFLAGFSAAVMLVTSLGVMPIVSANESGGTIVDVLSLQTFDDTSVWKNIENGPEETIGGVMHVLAGARVAMLEDAKGGQMLDIRYRNDSPRFIPNGTNTGLNKVGDKLVVSMDTHSNATMYFTPVVYQGYNTKDDATRKAIDSLFMINGNVLTHSNGGYAVSATDRDKEDAFTYNLPPVQMVNLNLVYTKKESGMSVDLYVNGALVKSADLAKDYLLNGPIQRINIVQGYLDNFSIKTYHDGAQFDPSPYRYSYDILPKVTFDNWQTQTFTSAGYYTGNNVNGSTPTNEKFKANNTGVVSIITDDASTGDKSLHSNVNGEFWYHADDNPALNANNYSGLHPGDQLVVSVDSFTDVNGNLTNVAYGDRYASSGNRAWTRFLEIDNGNINLFNGGDISGAYSSSNPLGLLGWVNWYGTEVSINVVYTAYNKADGSLGIKVSLYLDGKLATITLNGSNNNVTEAELAHNVAFVGAIQRFEVNQGHWDNLNLKVYRGGGFDASKYIKKSVGKLMPELSFDNIETASDIANNSVIGDANTNTALSIYDAESDVVASTGMGKATTDKYFISAGNTQYRNDKNSVLSKYKGLKAGDQLVINMQVNPTIAQGHGYIRYANGGRPYPYIFNTTSGNKDTLPTLVIRNAENTTEDNDGISNEPIKTVNLPRNVWSTVTLVYTAGTTDTVAAYVNGECVLAATPLAESNLEKPIERFDFQGGAYDNISVQIYVLGDKYTPNTSLEDKYFIQDGTTLAQFNETIVAKGYKVEYIGKNGAVISADGNIADVDYVSLTAADKLDYLVKLDTAKEFFNHADSSELKYIAMEYLDGVGPKERPDQSFGEDLDGVYGKADGDKAIEIIRTEGYTEEGDYDLTEDVETGYTINDIVKRIRFFNGYGYGDSKWNSIPLYISFDVLVKSGAIQLSGGMYFADNTREGGANVVKLDATDELDVTTIANSTETDTELNFNLNEWHNIAVQLIPESSTYYVYVDGQKFDGTLKEEFEGFNNLNLDVNGNALIDNLIFKSGIHTPATVADASLTVAPDADFGRGIAWDGSKLVTNKTALAYSAEIANAFTSEGNTVVLIDAGGAVATEGGTIDQIVVCGADGGLHYYKVVPRTTTGLVDEGNGNYILDVADDSDYAVTDVNMFVVTYDSENNTITAVNVLNPTSVAGDTFFFDDVDFDSATQSMFIFHNGTLAPLK